MGSDRGEGKRRRAGPSTERPPAWATSCDGRQSCRPLASTGDEHSLSESVKASPLCFSSSLLSSLPSVLLSDAPLSRCSSPPHRPRQRPDLLAPNRAAPPITFPPPIPARSKCPPIPPVRWLRPRPRRRSCRSRTRPISWRRRRHAPLRPARAAASARRVVCVPDTSPALGSPSDCHRRR